MKIFSDKFGRKIKLTNERLVHILEHPEMIGHKEKIEETLRFPEYVKESKYDKNVWLYYRDYKDAPPKTNYLIVIVRILDDHGFIITSFFVKNIEKNGEWIWKAH